MLEGVNREKVGFRRVHVQKGGVVERRGLSVQLLVLTRCANIGARGRETKERDGGLRKERNDTNLGVELANFLDSWGRGHYVIMKQREKRLAWVQDQRRAPRITRSRLVEEFVGRIGVRKSGG